MILSYLKFGLLLSAQIFQPFVSNIDIDAGLSSNTVFSISQDSIGYVWIGTSSGLDRFDGVSIKHYHNNPFDSSSLSSNLVQHILHDSRGRMWVSTRNGLNLYNRDEDNFRRFVVNESDTKAIQNDDIWHAYEDRNGVIWLCTRRNGLIRFNTQTNYFKSYKFDENDPNSIASNRVTDVIEDRDGNLFVVSVTHQKFILNRYLSDSDSFERIYFSEIKSSMNVAAADNDGQIYLGSFDAGIVKYFPKNKTFINYALPGGEFTIRSMVFDRNDRLWLGTSDNGVYKFNPASSVYQNFISKPVFDNGISFNTVWDVFEDDCGAIWLGTFGGGVDVINPNQEKFNLDFIIDPSIQEKIVDVTSFLELGNGNLLIGTYGNGLFIKNGELVENVLPNSNYSIKFPDNRITQIVGDTKGNIWISTVQTICMMDSNLKTIILFDEGASDEDLSSGAVNDLMVDEENNIWAATHNGLNILKSDSKTVRKIFHDKNKSNSILRNHIYDLYLDSQNYIWIATAGGLSSLSPDRKTYSHYTAEKNVEEGIRNNFITNIAEDADNNIWISTFGGGVNRIDRLTNQITTYDYAHGLADDRASSIVYGSDSSIWVGTKNGLSKIDLKNLAVTNYYDVDGLAGNEFNGNAAYKSPTGKIFLGGNKGFNSFHPNSIREEVCASNLVLTNFKLFNEDYKFDHPIEDIDKIELDYFQNFFTFEFALLDYSYPKRNHYKYKLEGLDKHWIDAENNNQADYTSVEPGAYTFRVAAANSKNAWSKDELRIAVVITPPYYQTWWFITIAVIIILLILIGIYRYRIHEIKKVQSLRDNIHQNLHDELGSTLTSINYFARAMQNDSGKQIKFLNNIITSSDDARERIKDMMWVVNPKNDSIVDLLSRVQRFASETFESAGINYKINLPQLNTDYKVGMSSRQNIWLIFKEITANIIKHSQAKEAYLKIEVNDYKVSAIIGDDGIGFDKNKVYNGEGLKSIKKRVEDLNGEMTIISNHNDGTNYTLSFELTKK